MMELIVSIFIIGMISSIFLANYRGSNNKNEVVLAAQKLASDIRLAQNYSLSTKEFSAGVPVPGGWGIRASSTATANDHYILFADRNESKTYNNNEKFARISLPAGVTISNIKVNGVNSSPLNLVFLPPDPATYINTLATNEAAITVRDAQGNSKIISINYLGLIDVN